MPVSRKHHDAPPAPSQPSTLTLAELVELRRTLPEVPSSTDARASLSERFLLPPFSILDARQGYWQKRKKTWLQLGIQSELGRGDTPSTHYSDQAVTHYKGANKQSDMALRLAGGFQNHPAHSSRANATVTGSPMPAMDLINGRTQRGDGHGRPLNRAHPIPGGGTGKNSAYMFKTEDGYESLKDQSTKRLAKAFNIGMEANKDNNWSTEDNQGSGTSIFDPVLCEIACRWFCPPSGRILDPFAGGSVRGIVAARLGRGYAGVDLRSEQAEANYAQAEWICPDAEDLTWVTGDSLDITALLPNTYDLVFSCPPYADLERYSDDPRDLSTMDYDTFLEVYRAIIHGSCSMLKEDRFAVWVVGDIRDRTTGNYRGFVGDTIAAFRSAGLELYNEAVLVTAVGSLPIRVGKQFAGARKLGKSHQNVLVFLKGDSGRASEACGEIDLADLEMPDPIPEAVLMCQQDALGTIAATLFADEGLDTFLIDLPTLEARALLADIARGQARAMGKPSPRIWIGTQNGWTRVEDSVNLTYLLDNTPYLNRTVFPGATMPIDRPPPPQALR